MNVPATSPELELTWAAAEVSDAAELSRLHNLIADFEDTPERIGPETMEHELGAAFQPLEQKTIVGRGNSGSVVAYGTVYHRSSDAAEQRSYFSVHVDPGWRGRGIEDALVDWGVAAGGRLLDAAVGSEKYLCSWLYKKLEEAAGRLQSRGFEPVRHWWEMERPLDQQLEERPEEGFIVVPWSDEHSVSTRAVCNAAFTDHWGFTPMSEEYWRNDLIGSPGFRQGLSFVAEANGEVVGYSYNTVYEEDWEAAGRSEAWIGGLGVLSQWRKQGIATALLTRSMQAMKAAGLEAAMIGVDSSSPTGAQHLYHALGFRTTTTGTTWQRRYA